jgi:two-component system, LytTR family, response regulator
MKVIIIDDAKAMHLILKRILAKAEGVEVTASFRETESAFLHLESHHVDLALVDVSMPKETGLEFAKRLRESGRNLRLIFITSHKEHALSAFDVFAYDYIVKPVDQDRLLQTIRRAQSEHRPHAAAKGLAEDASGIAFNGLGEIEIRDSENRIVKWKTSKSAEVFCYLLLQKGRLVSRARIVEDIFGDMPHKNGETYLNTSVYQLRKLLDSHGLKDRLHSDGSHYALDLNQVRVDMIRFEEGCRRMAVVDDKNMEEALELEQLYRGELFGERAYAWAWSEAERLSEMHATLVERLSDALLSKGEAQTAVRLLKKLVASDELRETAWVLLLKALVHQNNREALTQQYQRYQESLHRELGIQPSPEVANLYNELLAALEG